MRDVLHGVEVRDPWRWLEHGDAGDVQAWVSAENALARATLDRIPVRAAFAQRLEELTDVTQTGLPHRRGDRVFFARHVRGARTSALYVRDRADARERTLVDPSTWGADDRGVLSGYWPSHDGRTVIYAESRDNTEELTFHIMDVASGAVSATDTIAHVYDSSASWSAHDDGFYYRWSPSDPGIALPDLPGHAEVRFHRLGMPPSSDRVVRPATGDPHVTEYPYASRDGRWLFLHVQHGFTRQDVVALDLAEPNARWAPIATGEASAWILDAGDRFLLMTNEGAPKRQVFVVDPARPERAQWKLIVPERQDAVIVDARVVGHRLLVHRDKDAVGTLETCELDGTRCTAVSVGAGPVVIDGVSGRPEDDHAYVAVSSLAAPPQTIAVDVATGTVTPWEKPDVPLDSSQLVEELSFFASKDGTRVPLFLVHRRDIRATGDVPTIVTGYGGFGSSVVTSFDPGVAAWVEHGGVYATAGLRGGSEYGEPWHVAGMRHNKQNVFDDFFAEAKAVMTMGWTRPDRLVAEGWSNGGLLVAAAITQHPELYRAAIIGVPLTDMIRFPLFGDGKQWTSEYGSPDDPEDFRALFAYSPYHHVQQGVRYPTVLLRSSDEDDLVDPLHARKFAAALQWASMGGPVLLATRQRAGHFGGAAVSEGVASQAEELAFAWSAATEAN